MKIAITGASGTLARYFKEEFPDALLLSRKNCTYETEDLRKKLKDVDYVIHLAGKIFGKDLFKANVKVTENLVNALDKQKLFFASTIAVYGRRDLENVDENTEPEPNDLYGLTKLYAEHIIRETHKNHVIARIGTIYGEYYSIYIKMLKLWKVWPFYFKNVRVPFTYARDVVEFSKLPLKGTYIVSSPGYKMLEIINDVKEVLGIKKPPIKVPVPLGKLLLKEKIVPLILDRSFNVEKSLNRGWKITPFKEGIKAFLPYL